MNNQRIQETVSYLEAMASDPEATLTGWKERTQRKIVGLLAMYIPEEILHAAGILPAGLWETSEPFVQAYEHIHNFTCSVVRSAVNMAAKGQLDFLDGIVISELCLTLRGTEYILRKVLGTTPYLKTLYLPSTLRVPTSRGYTIDEFTGFKASIESWNKSVITDDVLSESLVIYNRNRALLSELFDLRRRNPGLLRTREMRAIILAGVLMPKEEHNNYLEGLLSEMRGANPSGDGRMKVVLSGYLCFAPPTEILDLIEDSGAVVADDDFWVGRRYFTTMTEAEGKSPIEALADRYLNMGVPCPTRVDLSSDWGTYIIDMVKASQALGVIILLPKYCEPHGVYYVDVRRRLNAANIPHLLLEIDHEILGLGQMKTRIQAFIETLKGG